MARTCFKAALISVSFTLGRELVAFVPKSKHKGLWIVISLILLLTSAGWEVFPPETFLFDPSKWTVVNWTKKKWLAFSDDWCSGNGCLIGIDLSTRCSVLDSEEVHLSRKQRDVINDCHCHGAVWYCRPPKGRELSRSVLMSFRALGCSSLAQWDRLARRVSKCRLLRPSRSPDGLCSLLQSAHKGDIIARAGWDKVTAFGASQSPPFPIAPILFHSILTDYPPLPYCPIIPLQQQANLSL